MNFIPKDHLAYMAVAGSHSYGSATPTSDFDIKGVIVPPIRYFTGFSSTFEQLVSPEVIAENFSEFLPEKHRSDKLDGTIFGIQKFFKLAADCNPNVLEQLFVREEDKIYCHPAFRKVVDNKEKFLSQRAFYTFSGYAVSQLKRIKTHRVWLLNPPKEKPTREKFGLHPDRTEINKELRDFLFAKVQGVLDGWKLDLSEVKPATKEQILGNISDYLEDLHFGNDEHFYAAGRKLGLGDDILFGLDKERRFKQALTEFNQYEDWKKDRNPARAELEAKYGYDGKHGSHLYRLMTMLEEILKTGTFQTFRPDAKFLLEIRNGVWSYDQLIEWMNDFNKNLEELKKKTTLPKTVNVNFLENLHMEVVSEFLEI